MRLTKFITFVAVLFLSVGAFAQSNHDHHKTMDHKKYKNCRLCEKGHHSLCRHTCCDLKHPKELKKKDKELKKCPSKVRVERPVNGKTIRKIPRETNVKLK